MVPQTLFYDELIETHSVLIKQFTNNIFKIINFKNTLARSKNVLKTLQKLFCKSFDNVRRVWQFFTRFCLGVFIGDPIFDDLDLSVIVLMLSV